MTTVDSLAAAGASLLVGVRPDPYVVELRQRGAGGELFLQRCRSCGYRRLPPAALCPECLSTGADWVTDPGTGAIWSFCVYHRAFAQPFTGLVPYVVALVELDSGPSLITNVVGVEPGQVRIGQRGTVVPHPLPDNGSLLYFHPAGEPDGDPAGRTDVPDETRPEGRQP